MSKCDFSRADQETTIRLIDETVRGQIAERDAKIHLLEDRLARAERQKPNLDKWFEENIEEIIKKFNEYGVDMKIRNNKKTQKR